MSALITMKVPESLSSAFFTARRCRNPPRRSRSASGPPRGSVRRRTDPLREEVEQHLEVVDPLGGQQPDDVFHHRPVRTFRIGLGSFSVNGRASFRTPPAITTAFMSMPPWWKCARYRCGQDATPRGTEGEGEEDEKDGAGADDAAVDPVGEPAPPRRDRRPDEGSTTPRRTGCARRRRRGRPATPAPAKAAGTRGRSSPPERPVRVRGGGDDPVDHGTHPRRSVPVVRPPREPPSAASKWSVRTSRAIPAAIRRSIADPSRAIAMIAASPGSTPSARTGEGTRAPPRGSRARGRAAARRKNAVEACRM